MCKIKDNIQVTPIGYNIRIPQNKITTTEQWCSTSHNFGCIITDIARQIGKERENFVLSQIHEWAERKGYSELVAIDEKSLEELIGIREKFRELELTLFMVVRQTCSLPLGKHLNKSNKEIAEKTFEMIESIKKQINYADAEKQFNLVRKNKTEE